MRKNKHAEKEYRKKHFFVSDDEYDNEYDEEEIDEDDEEDEDDEDDDEAGDDDDIDEDDEDEEDDEDIEEDDEDDEDDDAGTDRGRGGSEAARRARRHSRRIRNQILAYATVVLMIAGALGGAFWGGRKLVRKFQENKQEREQRQEELTDSEQEEEPVVDMESTPAEGAQSDEAALSPLDEIVMARIAEMPLTDKVAALFIIEPEQITGVDAVTRAGDATREALTTYKVGGLVYGARNITGEAQLKELLANTALIDQTLFLAVNEEGGKNSAVASKLSVTEVTDMASVAGVDGARLAGSDTGAYLAEYGFNLNLAPVADVKISEDSILGNRSFGSDASQVGEMAAAYVQGLTEKGVSACVKTFPGLGSVTESTADGMADTSRGLNDMEGTEFVAYQAAINAGSEFVMVGTISAPALTGGDNTPCCLSPSVIGLLRNNLGYDGIIITGALNEASIKDYYTSAEAAEKALRAGADMLYMPENFKEAYEGLRQAAEADVGLQSRIDEALQRIYRVKYKDRV